MTSDTKWETCPQCGREYPVIIYASGTMPESYMDAHALGHVIDWVCQGVKRMIRSIYPGRR